jgi:hypothetical protein
MREIDRVVDEQAISGEVLDPEGYIQVAYDKHGLEPALGAYLDGRPTDQADQDVTARLAGFSMQVAEAAMTPAGIDIDTVRFGVDYLTRSMNKVCSDRFGYEPAKSWSEALLRKLGVGKPENGRYVRGLDDRFWTKQFSEEYATEHFVRREADEDDQHYLGRHLQASIHGYIFAPFTYMAG